MSAQNHNSTDCIFQTHPTESSVSVTSFVTPPARRPPQPPAPVPTEMNGSLWELQGTGATPACSPTSVYCTVVICGCIPLLPVLSSLRKWMLYSALIHKHLGQCLAESKC